MRQLGFPTLLCHKLEIDGSDRVVGYQLRQKDPKRQSVIAFKSLYYRVIAAGAPTTTPPCFPRPTPASCSMPRKT